MSSSIPASAVDKQPTRIAGVPQRRRGLARLPALVRRHALSAAGLVLVVGLVGITLAAPLLASYDPLAMSSGTRFARPGGAHLLGTDQFGRDILSRILYGSRISLGVGIGSVILALVVGMVLGSLAAMREGALDSVIMRTMDVLFAFPAILLALALIAVLGSTARNVLLAIGLVYIPIFARTVRAAVLTIKYREFVDAAWALGRSGLSTYVTHILPNALTPILVQATLSMSTAILAEAALSFLGVGAQPPAPSWGGMLSESRAFMEVAPWTAVFPGLAIMLAVLSFNLLGDGIRDYLDPQIRTL
jgi:peptide/nickel transport system permease protein